MPVVLLLVEAREHTITLFRRVLVDKVGLLHSIRTDCTALLVDEVSVLVILRVRDLRRILGVSLLELLLVDWLVLLRHSYHLLLIEQVVLVASKHHVLVLRLRLRLGLLVRLLVKGRGVYLKQILRLVHLLTTELYLVRIDHIGRGQLLGEHRGLLLID